MNKEAGILETLCDFATLPLCPFAPLREMRETNTDNEI